MLGLARVGQVTDTDDDSSTTMADVLTQLQTCLDQVSLSVCLVGAARPAS